MTDLPLLVLVRDLIFMSKVRAAAESAGVPIRVVREASKLAAEDGAGLLVDLNLDGAIQAAGDWKQRTGGIVRAFVAHTDGETIALARAAGLDNIQARSAFFANLPAQFAALNK